MIPTIVDAEYVVVEYKSVSYEELSMLAKSMVKYARNQPPFDSQKVAANIKNNKSVKAEPFGDMLRVCGDVILDELHQYTRFVLIGIHPLQLCYYEMEIENMGRVGQLTVVDNRGLSLEEKLSAILIGEFFGYENDSFHIMPTPPHVTVAVCKV